MNTSISFQNSNIDWVGSIPSSWEMKKGKYLFSNKKEINSENQCDNLLSLTLFGVLNKDMESSEGLRPLNYKTYQIFEKNDMVFKLIDLENKKTSRVGLVHEKGIMSPVYIRLIPKENSLPKYFYYQYYDLYKKYIFNYLGSGVRSSLNPTDLMEIPLVLPPLPEQTQIVSFLDTKTQKIDELIEKTEQKIELLKEKRTSLINHCVTKGLNPNVDMKDSGVEWIGEIPSHWDFIPTKYFTIHKNGIQTGPFGTQLNTKDYVDNGVKVMNQKTLIDEDYDIGEEFISYEKYEDLKVFEVLDGDMIMGTRGSFGKGKRTTFGKVSIVPKGLGDCVLHPCLIRIRLKENLILKNYYYFYINDSTFFLEDIRNTSNSTTIEVIYGITLKDIKIPVPPFKEQQQILKYINEQTQNIDSTIEKESKRIELLKEYRQSLISEVVTGKVDVRDWKE